MPAVWSASEKAGTGGVAETLLLRRREDIDPLGSVWECLVNPGKRLRQGARIEYRAGGLLAPEGSPVVLTSPIAPASCENLMPKPKRSYMTLV